MLARLLSAGSKRTPQRFQVPDTAHVVPIGDLITHELTDECLCGPETEPVEDDDGSIGWLIIHHSLDGRELQEG
jgi:hypothetical protein